MGGDFYFFPYREHFHVNNLCLIKMSLSELGASLKNGSNTSVPASAVVGIYIYLTSLSKKHCSCNYELSKHLDTNKTPAPF